MIEHTLNLGSPEIAADVWLAPTAVVFGDVKVRSGSSVWFGAVIRGDVAPISIGEGTNIQDLCCLHADPGLPCTVGNRVTVGHAAIIHGATVGDDTLIGIRAVVLNGATIGKNCLIGAGALIPEGASIPDGSVVLGTPGKVIRQVTPADLERIDRGWKHYSEASLQYRERFTLPPQVR